MPMKEQEKPFFATTLPFWAFEFGGAIIGAAIGSAFDSIGTGGFIGLLSGGFLYISLFYGGPHDSQE